MEERERSHAAAWVEAGGEPRENFNTEGNREEDEVERVENSNA